VVEPEIDTLDVNQCALGGIAKTQWAVFQASHQTPGGGPVEALPLVPTVRLRLRHRCSLEDAKKSAHAAREARKALLALGGCADRGESQRRAGRSSECA
jgi:hypothetical protein